MAWFGGLGFEPLVLVEGKWEIEENDKVKVFQKKRGNYTDRKEYVGRWSNNLFKVDKIEYDIMGNKTYNVAGIDKPLLRQHFVS